MPYSRLTRAERRALHLTHDQNKQIHRRIDVRLCLRTRAFHFVQREGGQKVPKLKTHRGAAKRFKLTKGRKIKRIKAYAGHIMTKKSTKRKRGLRQATYVHTSDSARIKMLLPYD